ncbi:MAG: hypothetical protein JRI54_14875, partial [Deltaproteobacteria bacterium]|nr:hypothetical protein [Deltaproteobacteria bacterium]
GVDAINVLFLTPLPGTRLWDKMEQEGRIAANNFPEDWKYYTLNYPVARYKHLSQTDMHREMDACCRTFYSYPHIASRIFGSLWHRHKPVGTLVTNLSIRNNALRFDRTAYPRLTLS